MSSKLLNEYPIIMSHDAATGYMVRDHIVAKWAMTQSVDFIDQLNCGSRGFDYRPYYHEGTLYAHHGGVKIAKPMKDSVLDVMSWCHDNQDELVLFYTNSCDGDAGCKEAALDLLQSLGVYTITDCNEFLSLTYDQAVAKATIEGGGSLLGVYDCILEEYDPEVNCYGQDFACYDSWPNESTEIPWNRMKSYLNLTTAEVPTTDGRLWMAQAHWQSTALSITLGTLHNSSLLLDEERSKINGWMAQQVTDKVYPHLNIVEVDHVCDHGLELYNSLAAYRT